MSNLEDVFVSWSLECIVFQSKSESKSGCLCAPRGGARRRFFMQGSDRESERERTI